MKKILSHAVLLLTAITYLHAFETPYFTGYTGFLGNLTSTPNSYRKPDKEEDTFSEQIEETFADPQLFAQGYFGGQLQFKDFLILRGEFGVDSNLYNPLDTNPYMPKIKDNETRYMTRAKEQSIIGKNILDKPSSLNSIFQVNEASAVVKLQTSTVTHYLSLFYGEYEPIGSDVFLQRQFGIGPIRSDLTSSFSSLNGTSINESYGAGFSYVLRLASPIAAGIYLYKDRNEMEEGTYRTWDDKEKRWTYNSKNIYKSWQVDPADKISNPRQQEAFNADFRVAGAFDYLTFDFRTGLALPEDTSEGSVENGFMNINYLSLKAGVSVLAGKPTSMFNVLLQTGFSDLLLDPGYVKTPKWKETEDGLVKNKSVLNWNNAAENFYFLLEPRLNLRQAKFSVTAFNIPYSQANKMFYLNNYNGGVNHRDDYMNEKRRNSYVRPYLNPCGIDFHAATDFLQLGDKNLTTGVHVTLSMGGQTFMDLYRDSKSDGKEGNKHYWNKTAFITPYAKLPVHGGEVFAAATVSTHIFDKQDNWPSSVSVKVGFKINF